jgi:hypothetical protein
MVYREQRMICREVHSRHTTTVAQILARREAEVGGEVLHENWNYLPTLTFRILQLSHAFLSLAFPSPGVPG